MIDTPIPMKTEYNGEEKPTSQVPGPECNNKLIYRESVQRSNVKLASSQHVVRTRFKSIHPSFARLCIFGLLA
jgi:hypothetical protein